jgi:hypothetical protein
VSHSKERLADPSEVFTLSDAARFMRVTTRTVHRWADAGLIKTYKIAGVGGNNNRRYLRSELLALLEPEEGKREPAPALVASRQLRPADLHGGETEPAAPRPPTRRH